ncbi:MAG: helix-turn-helix domain-containing protein [Proteobacteria bacterium]|nr:helix-turn-helix domain-containing protein [Pseudomonadota bacterium]
MSSCAERISTKKAAAYLGVSVRTLEEWRRRSIGPAFTKIGRKLIRYDLHELERFLKESK